MKKYLPWVLLGISMVACQDDVSKNVALRIENSNNFAYDGVFVSTPSGDHEYGLVPAKGKSAYYEYETMYSYAYINVTYADKEFILQPIDYVGEKPLAGGFYTFLLAVDTIQAGYGGLSFSLIKD